MFSAPSSEFTLQCLDPPEHLRRVQSAFDQSDGVGEFPACASDRGVEDNRRSLEQLKFLVELRDCGLDYARRTAEAAVRPVGTDRDCVEVRGFGQTTTVRPEPVEGPPFTSSLRTRTVLRQAEDEGYGEA